MKIHEYVHKKHLLILICLKLIYMYEMFMQMKKVDKTVAHMAFDGSTPLKISPNPILQIFGVF